MPPPSLSPRFASRSELGQGTTEILLLLGVLALLAFPALRLFGSGLRCGYFDNRAQLESADTEVERCAGEAVDSKASASGDEDDGTDFAADQPPLPEVPEMPPPPIRPDPGPNCKPAGTECGLLNFAYAPLGGHVSAPVPEECVTTCCNPFPKNPFDEYKLEHCKVTRGVTTAPCFCG